MHSTILHSDAHKRVHCQHVQLLYKPDHGHWFRKCRRHCCSLNSPPFPSLPFSLSLSLSLHELRKCQLAKGKAEAGSGRHIPNPSLTAGQSQSPNLAKVNFGHCSKSLCKDTKVIHSFIHLCKYSHTQTVHVQLECFSGTSWRQRQRQRRASDMSRIMPTLLASQWT